MKPTRLLFCAALLFGLTASNTASAASAATSSAKKPTYAVVGYYRDATPAANLVEKAVQEIGARMQGVMSVKDPETADQVVNVVFTKNAYQIYFDGRSPEAILAQQDFVDFNARVGTMLRDAMAFEHGRGK
jgi:hypothetical protein